MISPPRATPDDAPLISALRGDLDSSIKCLGARRYGTANGCADIQRHLNSELVVASPSAGYPSKVVHEIERPQLLSLVSLVVAIRLLFYLALLRKRAAPGIGQGS
jgi:hypothetical protein